MKTDEAAICNAEATILGLLSEGPRHPYQISLDVEERGMQTWSELSRTTVYKMLRRLELKRMVKGDSESTSGGRKRCVYRTTAKGAAALTGYLKQELSHHATHKSPFDAAIYWSDRLPNAETARLLGRYRKELKEAIDFWKCMVGYLADMGCPKSDQALCDRKAHMLEGELLWLDKYAKELEHA